MILLRIFTVASADKLSHDDIIFRRQYIIFRRQYSEYEKQLQRHEVFKSLFE